MSNENITEDSNQSDQNFSGQQVEKKGKNRNALIGILLVALVGTWGYMFYNNNQRGKEKESLTAQLVSGDSARSELQQELNDASLRLDDLKTSNAKADSLIQTKDKDIQALKSRIQKILSNQNATQAQLNEARRLIAQLKGNIDTYASEIESLKAENAQLTEQNAVVTSQRDVAQRSYDSANTVIRQKEDVIDVGSTLHASGFKITGIKEKNNGKEKATSKAKKVDRIRISFNLDENRITPSGAKDLYIAITSPDGTPVSVDALGSGSFQTRDGHDQFFTKRITINYQQGQDQNVSIDWDQSQFKTGDYKVEVYNNGFKIGQGSVHFRKGGLFG